MDNSVIDTRALTIGLACLILAPTTANGQDDATSLQGDFTSQIDVGDPALKGTTSTKIAGFSRSMTR
jgi:hypothetical protein